MIHSRLFCCCFLLCFVQLPSTAMSDSLKVEPYCDVEYGHYDPSVVGSKSAPNPSLSLYSEHVSRRAVSLLSFPLLCRTKLDFKSRF